MKNIIMVGLMAVLAISCKQSKNNKIETKPQSVFEQQVEDYLKKFPYQDTYEYTLKYTGGGMTTLLNTLPPNAKAVLEKAGSDRIVRMNNDTYYSGGAIDLSEGPVKLSANEHDENRFYSFQLMDDRNINFNNIIRPKGDYYLYHGEKPEGLNGVLIESPSTLMVLIVRVEVKDKNNVADIEAAQTIFYGFDISGPKINEFPVVDVLSSFDDKVVKRAHEMMDSVFATVPFFKLVPSPGQVPETVSYLHHAAQTKGAWGAPIADHSTYQMIFSDNNNNELNGSKGTYSLTTEEPEVDGFWSVTAYDTERGGFLHPNKDDRYHINNTSAVRNPDGTITFLFKTQCESGDVNCLEVPDGKFDLTVRYYLPSEELKNGTWKMPSPQLIK